MRDLVWHTGGCHCGAVTFEIKVPKDIDVTICNCRICSMTGFKHLFVKDDAFRLLTSWDALSEYRFNSKTARHLFCKTCGIKSFYKPRSHPGGWSINLNALDQTVFGDITYNDFDGANWEANIAGLKARDED